MSKTLAEAFERFWAAYPRRPDNPKAPARLLFERRVREGADPEAIVAAACAYAVAVAGRKIDPIFVPHARTWLSQRRWEDYLPQDVPASAETPQPTPEHPLDWLREEMAPDTWAAWIEPLQLTTEYGRVVIVARTWLAVDRVKRSWGDLIINRYGAAIGWTVERKDNAHGLDR